MTNKGEKGQIRKRKGNEGRDMANKEEKGQLMINCKNNKKLQYNEERARHEGRHRKTRMKNSQDKKNNTRYE